MSKLIDDMGDATNTTFTQNGAITPKSTKSAMLDWFSLSGAMRDRTDKDVANLFAKAFSENPEYALRSLFYLRDIRGGLGERKVFRTILKFLAKVDPKNLRANLHLIPEMGRWDDLWELLGTPVEQDVINLIRVQRVSDMLNFNENKPVSLMYRWLPSENTSSSETRLQGAIIRSRLNLTPREYRKELSTFRSYLKVVEVSMSARKWTQIKYDSVPSRASMIYRNAFKKHDAKGYGEYLAGLVKGTHKINASTLYPYDLVRLFLTDQYDGSETLDAQWAALPNYLPDDFGNAIVVADVSGSMKSSNYLPLASSIGLAMYFSERNKGIFKNSFITFSEEPSIIKIQGRALGDKIRAIDKADWDMNTNLQAVFDLILNTAVSNHLDISEMPTKIFIISDMEFDSAVEGGSNFTNIDRKYRAAGYHRPTLIFWNVNATSTMAPVTKSESGVVLVSGQSPVIFKAVLNNQEITPYDSMMEILHNPRYSVVKYTR